jgi:WD40 repeat protein
MGELFFSIFGTLGVYDIRKEGKESLYALSDNLDDEIYCVKVMKNNQRIVCGTSDGPIALFNWDYYDFFKDSILGHPGGVNCFDKYDENTLVTGCEDGSVRIVSISPKSITTMISDKIKLNLENNSFKDIQALTLNCNKSHVAVCANINYIKVYNIENLNTTSVMGEGQDESDSEKEEEESNSYNSKEESNLEEKVKEENNDSSKNNEENGGVSENEPLEDDGGDVDQSDGSFDSDDSSENKKEKKKGKNSLKLKALGKKRTSEWMVEKERRKQFFSDI